MVTQPAAREAAEEPEQNLNRTAVLADSLDEVSGAGRQVSFPPVLSLHTGGVVTPESLHTCTQVIWIHC